MKKILLTTALLISSFVYSGTVTTTQNGDWDLSTTWAGGLVPSTTDDVVIAHSVDVDDERTCKSLTINGSGRLDIEASLTVTTGNSSNAGELIIKTGGTLTSNSGDFTNTGLLTVRAGQDLIFSSASTTLTNTGTIDIKSSNSSFG